MSKVIKFSCNNAATVVLELNTDSAKDQHGVLKAASNMLYGAHLRSEGVAVTLVGGLVAVCNLGFQVTVMPYDHTTGNASDELVGYVLLFLRMAEDYRHVSAISSQVAISNEMLCYANKIEQLYTTGKKI